MTLTPVVADLTWLGDLRFEAAVDRASMTLDSTGVTGPSPVQALAAALAGCMSMDLAHVIRRGRHPLKALRTRVVAHRAGENPKRVVRAELRFSIEGDVPAEAARRAIELSRDKYCSVWQSLRQDIELEIAIELNGVECE
jgi:putative redox protein